MIYLSKKIFEIFLEFSGFFLIVPSDDGSEFHIIDPASPKDRASCIGEISDGEADRILQVCH